uniref:Uncharacterized protein n=1 Tax=Lactuca sativa TaxID=4236 RepID=A0A9R1VY60_LACSA|nr:hypothetical protein LSAT_V11C400215070 [Lactuca sativa]
MKTLLILVNFTNFLLTVQNKVRGYTQKTETWNMSSSQKIVPSLLFIRLKEVKSRNESFLAWGKMEDFLKIDQIVAQQIEKDNRFKKLVTHWFTPEYQIMCDLRRKIRAKMEEPHVFGKKSFARLAHEEALNNGVYPTRGQIYVKTRTRKNGIIVNEKAAQVMMPGNISTVPRNSNSINQRASSESHHNDDEIVLWQIKLSLKS